MNASDTSLQSKFILALSLGVVTLLGGSIDVLAAPLNLSKVPLYTNESVEPNFALTFDDSGSMVRTFVPDAFTDDAVLFPGYPHVDGADAGTDPDPIDTRCWWVNGNWTFSSEVNKLYYNPNITYAPPKQANGTSMPNRTFGSAPIDGIAYERGTNMTTRVLTNDFRIDWDLGGSAANRPITIRRATTTTVDAPGGTQTGGPPNVTAGANCEEYDTMYRIYPFADARAFYYQYTPASVTCLAVAAANRRFNNACFTAVDMTTQSAAQQGNFANWYSYYRTRSLLARTSLSRVFDAQQNLRVVWQALNSNALDANKTIATISGGSTQRTNLFNFVFTNPASGGTPNRVATQRVGNYFGGGNNQNNDLNTTNPYYDAVANRELSCRQNFHLLVTDGGWNGTAGVTGNFDAAAVTLPDGKAYADTPHTKIYFRENAANDDGLADNAFYYWSRDLRPSLTNNVPASYEDLTVGVTGPATPLGADELPSNRPEIYFNPKNDPATWQHMVQYIVGFGIGGNIPFPGGYDALRAGTYPGGWPNWGSDDATNEQVVDDTWHAAINGRGEFFSVSDPQELIDSLSNVFLSIGRRTASNTPVSISSGLLTSSTLGYQTLFDTSDWSGRVLATRLATSTPEWDVACILTGGVCPSVPSAGTLPGIAHGDRIIATLNTTSNTGVAFRFGNLSATQQADLNKDPVTLATDGLGAQRLDFIRGDRSREAPLGSFRTRKNILGAVVNSSATSVPRTSGYRDAVSFEPASVERATSYASFVDAIPLQNTLFFGANDGMLHAVNSASASNGGGRERWAYVPGMVAPNLNKLTSATALQYQSFVDATPQIRDAFINGAWKRVLVGSMRLGAQGVYALDVTNTLATGEGDVAAKVMWEFTDKSAGAANLGYTYGNPYIARMANGMWVALVPGGYNSEVADGSVGSGNAFLFIVRLDNGQLLRAFDLGAGTRGLSTPNAGDYRANGAAHDLDVIDSAFAGDLTGNIWRFNFESTSSAAWTVDKFFTAATNQAITVQPRMVRTAYQDSGSVRRKFVVTFGTGKYIENDDRATTFQQSYYGVFDQGPGAAGYPITQSLLQQQTLTQAGNIRSLTTSQVPVNRRGWYFNFLASGERNISTAFVRNVNGSLIFTTLAPLTSNPCEPNAVSFLMFVDATTGGVPGTGAAGLDTNNDGVADTTNIGALSASFDTNLDGTINNSDSPTASGIQLQGYAAGVTAISNVGGGTGSILLPEDALPRPDLNGNGIPDCQEAVPPNCSDNLTIPQSEWRRRAWREIGG
jgi:type IV pilus assembly protein PilY1